MDAGALLRKSVAILRGRKPVEIFVERGRPGNQLFRYMFAVELCQRTPLSTLTGYHLPHFGLVSRQTKPEAANPLYFDSMHKIDLNDIDRRR